MPIHYRRFTLPIQVLPKHDGEGYDGRRHYVPRKKELNAKAIHILAREYAPPEPWTGPIQLDIHCVRLLPKRLPERWKGVDRATLEGLPQFECKPDYTNQLKQAEDALEGVFFLDDHQVCCGTKSKSWGIEGCVRIFVAELTSAEHRALVRQWWKE